MRDEVVVTVAGAPRAVAAAGAAARVEVATAEEAAAAPVVPVVVATAAATDLMTAVGDVTERAISGRSAPRCRATSSPSVLGARIFCQKESTYPSDAAVLAMKLPMSEKDLVVEAQAFVAKETGKCSVMVGEKVGGGELGKQVGQ